MAKEKNATAPPAWFTLTEAATPATMQRVAAAVQEPELPLQVKLLPMQAHWFIGDSLLLANQANRDGMHANALSLTRQCLEAISVLELGMTKVPGAVDKLLAWEKDRVSPGEVRKWLSANVWPSYGRGLWNEPWSEFMAHLVKAVQPYAHYSARLMQWQSKLLGGYNEAEGTMYLEYGPRKYDPQKATRITLFHGILTFTLGRIWIASSPTPDSPFADLVDRLRQALGASRYLDGHQTNWDQQFWAILWDRKQGTILE